MELEYGVIKQNLIAVGSKYENGVHARWLFHGAGSAETLKKIVKDPKVGFKPWFNKRGLWGKGVYFARDAIYCLECPGVLTHCLNDQGYKMILLCLVQAGLHCVSEQHIVEDMPEVHEDLPIQVRYDTFVDCPSNPEMFVVPQGGANAYPAYIIHFA